MTLIWFSTDTLYSPESFLQVGFNINIVVEFSGAVSVYWMLCSSDIVRGTPSFHQVIVDISVEFQLFFFTEDPGRNLKKF